MEKCDVVETTIDGGTCSSTEVVPPGPSTSWTWYQPLVTALRPAAPSVAVCARLTWRWQTVRRGRCTRGDVYPAAARREESE